MASRVGWVALVVMALGAMGCARSPDTVVHLSAEGRTRWDVRDTDNELVCSLPCSVELDEEEAVQLVRSDGRVRFDVRQENLGAGSFSASVHTKKKHNHGALAARAFAAALMGAGSVLAKSDDRDHVTAGAVLSGMGAMVRVAGESADEETRDELWVRRTTKR